MVTTSYEYNLFNERLYAMGNCFKTEQEAEDARDARIILTRLQRLADEMNGERLRFNDWKDVDVYIMFVAAAYEGIHIISTNQWSVVNANSCFKSRESAEEARYILIKEFGKDRVKMALSGVWR